MARIEHRAEQAFTVGPEYTGTEVVRTAEPDSGLSRRGEYWYECEYCGQVVPGSETTRDVPLNQQGRRVCLRCLDRLSTDDLTVEQRQILQQAQIEESKSRPA